MSALFCFGLGYSATVMARSMRARGWRVAGTARTPEKVERLAADGFDAVLFTGEGPGSEVSSALREATHVLVSVAPGRDGDAVLRHHGADIAATSGIAWIGYLSTVGVYGDHGGAWVDEHAELRPRSQRAEYRAEAERAWLELGRTAGKCVQLFRLSGIYGPGRGPLEKVLAGTARRIVKPGQVFNRIHVEDIASSLEASVARPRAGAIYNVSDDEPAPPQDVVSHACELLGREPPPEVAFGDAEMTPMGRSFYGENKRVSNALLKSELGVKLAYPTYRDGLAALAAALKRPGVR